MTGKAHRIWIPLAAFFATLPLLLNGSSCGHDFDFHVLSWLEASTQLAHLQYPHWAFTPAWNAGEPRFIFYPPLSWALGALLGIVLPWHFVPAAFTWVALTVSGFTAHRLASRYVLGESAILAAIVYLANPYMLFTAYERTAYGELLAAAWLPLLFQAALSAQLRVEVLAVPIALLWLTNVPAAVMSCYALVVLACVRLITPSTTYGKSGLISFFRSGLRQFAWNKRRAGNFAGGVLLGLALSSVYLLPVAAERRFVQADMATIEGMRIADNTLFHHMIPVTEDTIAHDVVLRTASWTAVAVLASTLLAFLLSLRQPRLPFFSVGYIFSDPPPIDPNGPDPSISLVALAFVIVLFLTPASLPLWNHLPEMRFLQFPWRLCALLGVALSFFWAIAIERVNRLREQTLLRAFARCLPLAACLITPAWLLFHQPCDAEDTVEARAALYHSDLGTDPTDEYTPKDADNDALGKHDPPYWLAPLPDAPPPAGAMPGQAPMHLVLDLAAPKILILNRRSYPGWKVRLNGQSVTPWSDARDDGLLAIPLPKGKDDVDLIYSPPADWWAGLLLSLGALALIVCLDVKHRRWLMRVRMHQSRMYSRGFRVEK